MFGDKPYFHYQPGARALAQLNSGLQANSFGAHILSCGFSRLGSFSTNVVGPEQRYRVFQCAARQMVSLNEDKWTGIFSHYY
jgi:hypothetical protein